ncbi:MAG: hypothetical protein ACOYK9_05705 [Chlamydiia bacterium]
MTQLYSKAVIASNQYLAAVSTLGNESANKLTDVKKELITTNYQNALDSAASVKDSVMQDVKRMISDAAMTAAGGAVGVATGVATMKAANGFEKERAELDNLDKLLAAKPTGPTESAAVTTEPPIAEQLALKNSKGLDADGNVLDLTKLYVEVKGKLTEAPSANSNGKTPVTIEDIRKDFAGEADFAADVKKTIELKNRELSDKIEAKRQLMRMTNDTTHSGVESAKSTAGATFLHGKAGVDENSSLLNSAQENLRAVMQQSDSTIAENGQDMRKAAEELVRNMQSLQRG